MKKYLIVYAHPNPQSFSHSLMEKIKRTLQQKGNEVQVRDLYAMNFNPVLGPKDFEKLMKGQTLEDVAQEQKLIKEADEIVMIYPVWWASMPAILKGYIDRVFSYGFAYKKDEKGIIGLLASKQVTLINTHGAPFAYYQQIGMHDAFNKTVDMGIFSFCGVKVRDHKYFGEVPSVDKETREKWLNEIESLF